MTRLSSLEAEGQTFAGTVCSVVFVDSHEPRKVLLDTSNGPLPCFAWCQMQNVFSCCNPYLSSNSLCATSRQRIPLEKHDLSCCNPFLNSNNLSYTTRKQIPLEKHSKELTGTRRKPATNTSPCNIQTLSSKVCNEALADTVRNANCSKHTRTSYFLELGPSDTCNMVEASTRDKA